MEILAAKSSQLAGTRRQKNLSLADFGTSDIANFWLLYTDKFALPAAATFVRDAARASFGVVRDYAVARREPDDFFEHHSSARSPKYEHDELSFCFEDLDEKIRLLLDTVVPSNFVSLPLKLTQSSIHATALADDKYLRNTKMYLAVRAEMNEADLIAKAPYLLKVCSANHIEHLVRQALPGVPLTHSPRPPSAIPVKLNSQYFSVSQTGVAWEAVTRARNFAAYVPGDFPNAQLELIILLPEA